MRDGVVAEIGAWYKMVLLSCNGKKKKKKTLAMLKAKNYIK